MWIEISEVGDREYVFTLMLRYRSETGKILELEEILSKNETKLDGISTLMKVYFIYMFVLDT